MLGLRSAILNKPRASLCLLEVSFLLCLILQLAMIGNTSVSQAGYTSVFNFCWVSVTISTGVVSPVRVLS